MTSNDPHNASHWKTLAGDTMQAWDLGWEVAHRADCEDRECSVDDLLLDVMRDGCEDDAGWLEVASHVVDGIRAYREDR